MADKIIKAGGENLNELQNKIAQIEVEKSKLKEKIIELELEQQQIVTKVNVAVAEAYKKQAFASGLALPQNMQMGGM